MLAAHRKKGHSPAWPGGLSLGQCSASDGAAERRHACLAAQGGCSSHLAYLSRPGMAAAAEPFCLSLPRSLSLSSTCRHPRQQPDPHPTARWLLAPAPLPGGRPHAGWFFIRLVGWRQGSWLVTGQLAGGRAVAGGSCQQAHGSLTPWLRRRLAAAAAVQSACAWNAHPQPLACTACMPRCWLAAAVHRWCHA